MSAFDRQLLAEKAAAVERHLARVEQQLPRAPEELHPATAASDAVILHLWQAVQIVIDLALAACVRLKLGTPKDYGDAFQRLARAGHLAPELAARLVKAAGFRNAVAHAYEGLDMSRTFASAKSGPQDLRAFLVAMRALV